MSELSRVLVVGAASPHLENYLNRIEGQGFEIALISPEASFLSDRFPSTAVDFSLRKWGNLWRSPRRIREVLSAYRPDAVHVHQANAYAFYTFLALRGSGVPAVLSLWGSDVLLLHERSFLIRAMTRWVLKQAQVITADARYLLRAAEKQSGGLKAEQVVCNFGVALPEQLPAKEKLIYSNRNHYALYRIDRVIKSYVAARAAGAMDGYRLVIAGAGPETDVLKKQVEQSGFADEVSFVGFVDRERNNSFYAKATFYISLPESDGTAMSLLEAMAHGCVPVLSDLPANREWVEDGVNGWLVAEGDSDGLLRASRRQPETMAQMNREIIRERATLEGSTSNFVRALERAMELGLASGSK